MSKHDPKATLRQMVDCMSRAQELCGQNDLPAILNDWHKRLAFERVMEILGEAVKRLPPDLCQRYPVVQWKLIAGMRDRVSHGYDGIDYGILWNTVQDDLPGVAHTVAQISGIWMPTKNCNFSTARFQS